MKVLVLLLFVAVLGKVSSMPRQNPSYYANRPVLYRMAEESEEDDIQDDTNNEESSEEWVNDDNPPEFSKVFPSVPQTKAPPGFQGSAFQDVRQEIQQTGWKNAKKQNQRPYRHRADFNDDLEPRWRAFRDDSDEDEEDDVDEEEAEDDDPYPPVMEKIFPGLPPGSTNPEQGGRRPVIQSPSPQSVPQPAVEGGSGPAQGPPPSSARRFRSGVVPGSQPAYMNRRQFSYPQRQPFYVVSPARTPVRYAYVPRRQVSYQNRVPMGYPQRPMAYPQSRPVMHGYNRMPVQYVQQRQPVSMYNRRQFYQVPVKMSLPVRRYQSPAARSYYRVPNNNYRRQLRQYNRYY